MGDNVNQNEELVEFKELNFDFETMEGYLASQLEDSFSDLNLLEEDREKIANPDSLGKIIQDEIWKQFENQIGLNITSETLIQKYDREHPEEREPYNNSKVKDEIMKDQHYIDANKEMRNQQESGNLKDEYTGKILKQNDKANLDHVVSRKELYENQRRRQAGLDTKDLANKEENLKATNENLNKSKSDKSIEEYTNPKNMEQRKADLIKQNEMANKKIDEDNNMSEEEKRVKKEKINKALQNKLDADEKLMNQVDNNARWEINKDIAIGITKGTGKKILKDELKFELMSLLKEIINGFVRYLKSKAKTFGNFLSEIKESIRSFFSKLLSNIKNNVKTHIGTIVAEVGDTIYNGFFSTFKSLASFIKKGISVFIDVINYFKDKNNKDKPFSVKIAEAGKIVTIGLTAAGAIVLGDVVEKAILIQFPLLGATLANVIGLFLASLLSGIVGAIVLNWINGFIANRLRNEATKKIIEKQNDIINIQQHQIYFAEAHVEKSRAIALNTIMDRHKLFKEYVEDAFKKVINNDDNKISNDTVVITVTKNSKDLDEMQKDLENLL